jgi:glycosyltransferase involved in cell wall biosynthesis
MKVLHIMPSVHPQLGGPSAVIFPMLSALHHQGLVVSLVTTQHGHTTQASYPFPVTYCKPTYFARKEFIPSVELVRWLKNNICKYDLVHCHFLFTFSTTIAAWFCRNNGIPYLIRPLGHYVPWSLEQSSIKKQIYLSIIERKTLSYASAFHATSLGEAEALRQLLPTAQVFCIPLGVDPSTFTRPQTFIQPSEPFEILVLGRIHPKKRINLLLTALSKGAEHLRSPVRLVIAGNGNDEYLQELKTLAAKLPPSVSVSFPGYVEGDKKAQLLRQAHLSVCLSYHENFAVAVAESLAVGCPVVVSEGVQIAPLIERYRCGKVVDSRESTIIEAIRYYQSNPDSRLEQGENGAVMVAAEFSWPKIAHQLELAYGTILENTQVHNLRMQR